MANDLQHECTRCGHQTAQWMGFCPGCRSRGSMVSAAPGGSSPVTPTPLSVVGDDDHGETHEPAGLAEVDRVLGGGLVAGSVILVGGEPGVGKSTLLLQVAGARALSGPVLYVAGEESAGQVAARARRIGAVGDAIHVLTATEVEAVEQAVGALRPSLVVVDSVQTMSSTDADGVPGGVTQVRTCGARFTAMARRAGVPVMLVGHVTKDGNLAGPKVLEHLVDVVLYLEGDPERGLRYLRGIKNRHGSVSQVGVFELTEGGFREIPDPTGVFVGGWSGSEPGTVIYPAMYGRRSLLVEVQALVSSTAAPQPRRSVKGLDAGRVHQILAVLERHVGIGCSGHDVYVNVVGGLTLRDPAADLAVAVAIASSRLESPVGSLAAFGEVGLAGEVRAVAHHERRVEEARRFGVVHTLIGGEIDRIAAVVAAIGHGPPTRRRTGLASVGV